MFVFKSWKKQAMLINAVSLLSVVFLLLLIEQVNTEGVNIKLDMEGDDASEGGKDALLTTDPPPTTTTTTTTKATTSTTPKKEEAPQEGWFANALSGLENLAGRDGRSRKYTPEEEAAAEAFLVAMLIGFCCCCACCIGFAVLLVKVLSK
uniref:Uncharacterized protein n=2 Tax=Meloidogyne TaxID=189290 RepID=A0A6V7VHD8_MELEN|nr:unnamed protein product [Meloidogyne enterolobii]